jgi:signal transduction histidine kinase
MSEREPDPLGRGPALACPGGIQGGTAIIDRMASAIAARDLRPQRFDLVLIGTAAAMTVVTVLLVADPSLRVVFVDRTLDVAITSFSALAALGLAVLTLPRYRESDHLSLLLQAAAFVTLAVFSVATVGLVLLKLDSRLGMSLGVPEQLPLWLSAANRLMVAGLFFAAGVAAIRDLRLHSRHPRLVAILPAVGLAALGVVLFPLRDMLPPLIGPKGIEVLLELTGTPSAEVAATSRLPGITTLELAGVAVSVVLTAGAAVLFRTTSVRSGRVSDGYLAVGLVIAAYAELQHAFFPSIYTGLVTASDAMRLLSYGVLLLGIHAAQREDLRELRAAYSALDRLRVTEAERAALEERSRLAREIHDGLAQQLWFAKLKFERLASTLDEEQRPLAGEVAQSLDSAIVEARQAMVTMRSNLEADLPLTDMLARAVDDFEQRSGLPVRFTPGPGLPPAIPPRQQIELLRVVQEALANIAKHADATVVRVRSEVVGRDLVVSVTDNGIGFDPRHVPEGRMGLRGMEERARLMGGNLRVVSELHGGTTVEVAVPILVSDWVPAMAEAAAAATGREASGTGAGATGTAGTGSLAAGAGPVATGTGSIAHGAGLAGTVQIPPETGSALTRHAP